jgi:choline kinase
MKIKHSRYIVSTRPNKEVDKRITTIILGGSIGYREKSAGTKSMIKAENGKTVLSNQIETINNVYENCDIILTTGTQTDRIAKDKPKQCRIVENQLYETTGEFEQLRLALNNCVTEEVIIINGIIFFDEQSIKEIVNKNNFNILVHKNMMKDNEVGVTIVDNIATIFSYSISDYKWCNIMYIKGNDLKMLKSIVNNRENSKLMTFEAINIMLSKKVKINTIFSKSNVIVKLDGTNSIDRKLRKQ